jgi:hypothetical protein
VLSTLRQRKSHPCLHGLRFVLLLSWLALLVPGTCFLSPLLQAAAMADCPAEPPASGKAHLPEPDCSVKPCLAAPSGSGVASLRADPPELPPVVLCLAWVAFAWPRRAPPLPWLKAPDPSPGGPVLLFYRYCTLLN